MSIRKSQLSLNINSVFCINHQSGTPFFTKQYGSVPLPFSVIGSLGGLYTFADNEDASVLKSIRHNDLKIRYRLFGEVVLVVHVTNDPFISDNYIETGSEHLYMAIVTEMGEKALSSCQNADILKSTVSKALSAISNYIFSEFNNYSASLLSHPVSSFDRPTKAWNSRLEKYLDLVETGYGCVFHGTDCHAISGEFEKLPYQECLCLLQYCASLNTADRRLTRRHVHLPLSAPNDKFQLICVEYEPFRVFAICPPNTSDGTVLGAFNKVFSDKHKEILNSGLSDKLRFDNSICALASVRESESVCYIAEGLNGSEMKKLLSYSLSRSLISDQVSDPNGTIGQVEFFSVVSDKYNCQLIGNGEVVVTALFKPSLPQLVTRALVRDIVEFFTNKSKK
eukprot:sb/3465445/